MAASMATLTDRECVVVVGKESAGKSQLVQSLTGRQTHTSNFRGVTVACEVYAGEQTAFVDTPGILVGSDAVTTRLALDRLRDSDTALLVVRGTHIDDDLADILPLAHGKRGAIVVTFWDKVVQQHGALRSLDRLRTELDVPVVAVDSRQVTRTERADIEAALARPSFVPALPSGLRIGWQVEPAPSILDHPRIGVLIAAALMLLPSIVVVWFANTFAQLVEPPVQAITASVVSALGTLPQPLAAILTGRYGLLTMGPLLFVWSVPTVVLFALLLAAYKASGLIDRITNVMHPLMQWCGLTGRDLIRIVMGFGCNVPAVINTRACCSATRGACISTIAFASACSYQLGATLAVFGAAGRPWLAVPYLLVLLVSALLYARLTTGPQRRGLSMVLVREGRAFLEWPRPAKIWQEMRSTLVQFFGMAIPLFLVITAIASLLDWMGVVTAVVSAISPLTAVLNLPAEAALPIVLASIRKDGILLFAEPQLAGTLTAGQLLTGVYVAGTLLPCMVTALTIGVEQSPRFLVKLLVRQAAAAIVFTIVLAQIVTRLGL